MLPIKRLPPPIVARGKKVSVQNLREVFTVPKLIGGVLGPGSFSGGPGGVWGGPT